MSSTSRRYLLGLLLFITLLSSLHAAPPNLRATPHWQWIYYPAVEIPSARGQVCSVMVGADFVGGEPQLRCDVIWSGRDPATPPEAIVKRGRITARLHGPGGTVVEPTNRDDFPAPGISNAGGTSYSRMFLFPWMANQLAETWCELKIDDRTYWVEVPYGLTRDPAAPAPRSEPDAGPPALAPAMQQMAPGDRLVPWQNIEFDLGVIQNGWRLELQKENVDGAHWLVTLYREGEPWSLATPRISVELAVDGGAKLTPQWIKGWLPNPFRRTDEYVFAKESGKGRAWGTLTIGVDKHLTKILIPSSLFRDGHGAAEPNHPQRLPVGAIPWR